MHKFHKLTVNGTSSSEALHSDLDGTLRLRAHSDLEGHSGLGSHFQFGGIIQIS